MKFCLLLIKSYFLNDYIKFQKLYSKAPEFTVWFIDLLLPKYRNKILIILRKSFLNINYEYCKKILIFNDDNEFQSFLNSNNLIYQDNLILLKEKK